MSIWSVDLGIDPSWPEWFKEHRRLWDAEIRTKAAEEKVLGRRLTSEEVRAWALEQVEHHRLWRASLPAEQRAWLDAADAEEEHTVRASADPTRRLDLEKLLGELGRKR